MKKFDESKKYYIGQRHLEFRQGEKNIGDYVIWWDGQTQFSDKELFSELYNHATFECAKVLIKHFICCDAVSFNDNCVKTNINNVNDIIEFVNQTKLPYILKFCLASIIFRCDIDNINYNCPKYNGCVRHFMQILMLFGYKFNISKCKMDKLFIKQFEFDKIPEIISSIGYPNNERKISTNDFKCMYQCIASFISESKITGKIDNWFKQ